MAERVFIGLGGNLGDSRSLFRSAISSMSRLQDTYVVTVSSVYRTPPMGPEDQGDYSNAVVELETELQPLALLDGLQTIELEHGRARKDERWGPRTLDLDILLFGAHIIDEQRLVVPHYGMAKRSFVVVPLYELVGEGFQIPVLGSLDRLYKGIENDPIECLGLLESL